MHESEVVVEHSHERRSISLSDVAFHRITMADTQETAEQELYRCYHCGLESAEFKYFDNRKADQPRYKCTHCQKLFTVGFHGRPQGKSYTKKRNQDPDELKCLSRQCRHCGVANNARFKYYNNHQSSQPRFKCLSCGKQFQMRVLGTGEERRLVHTSSAVQPRAPRRKNQGVPEHFPDASNFTGAGVRYNEAPYDVMGEMVPESTSNNVEVLYGTLALENPAATGSEPAKNTQNDTSVDPYNNVNNAKDVATFCSQMDFEMPIENFEEQIDTFEDLFARDYPDNLAGVRYNEAPYDVMVSDNMAEMVPESTSNNVEVMYGTLALENPAATGSEPAKNTQNDTSVDPYNVNYVKDVATFCSQMDFEMPIENSEEQIDTFEDVLARDYPDDVNFPMDDEGFWRQIDLEIAMRNYIPWNR